MTEPSNDREDDRVASTSFGPVVSLLVALAITGAVRQVGRRWGIAGLAPAPVKAGREPRPEAEPALTPTQQQARAIDADIKRSPKRAEEPGRGREAEGPTQIPPRGWWDVARRVYDEIDQDRILAVAAGVTFYVLLALVPAIGAFVALYGIVADRSTINDHLSALGSILPSGAIDIIGDQVKRITSKGDTTLGLTFFTGLGVSLWSANAGMKAVFDALNVAYEEKEKRSFIMLNLWSLLFTFMAIVFLAGSLGAVVILPVVLKFVGLGDATEWLLWIGRWPALLLVTIGALSVLYRYGPSRRRARWVWMGPGAIFATLGWMAVSMLFSWYVASFGSYNETYGSLGALIGFLTWMWLSWIVVLVGAEISAETEHQTAQDTTGGPPRPMGSRGAHMADTVGAAH